MIDIDFYIDHCQYKCMSNCVVVPCCPPVLQGRLAKADAKQLALVFKAIADPARLRLLSFIAAQPSGEACVCHLTKPLGITQPTVSHHLKVLYDAGLLARERRGTWVYYRIVPERLATLRDALAAPALELRQRGSSASKTRDVSRGRAVRARQGG
jgi:ArsR family transcriptional regulator, arsenate/arsenite/antimonite-responsive transcriptional repressor